MNRHVGASFTLSVLVVGFFAVVLYQPDPVRPTTKPLAPKAAPAAGSASPRPTPGVPLVEASTGPIPSPLEDEASKPRVKTTSRSVPRPEAPRRVGNPPGDDPPVSRPETSSPLVLAGPSTTGSPPARARAHPPAPARVRARHPALAPRSAFTQVGEGESLTDVAVRVYGTSEAARKLWLANRDIMDAKDAPLRMGMLLRTP